MAGANQKKKADRLCAEWIVASGVPPFNGPVRVHFDWYVSDRRDPDNIRTGAKFILDALIDTGKLPNDDQNVVLGLSDTFQKDKENPRVEVTIESA